LRRNQTPAKGDIAMLVLTRRPGETLIIELPTGEQITVRVLEVKGNQVRIGTDAPSDISIVREELLERLPAES
jgi:carbon storage regulator